MENNQHEEINKFKNGKIYKIACNTTGKCYYGSTVKSLEQRLRKHESDYERYKQGKANYITSYEVIKQYDYEIVLMEECICNSKEELRKRERYYIELNECVNKLIPSRTIEEYRKDYYESNKDYIAEQTKIYRDNHKAEMKEYNERYRDENKEVISQKKSEYREKNADKIKQYSNTLIVCECGSTYMRTNKSRHLKTEKHVQFMEDNV
jgi:hypothetical protein